MFDRSLALLEQVANIGLAVFAVLAAFYWFKSANVSIRDSMDHFIADLAAASAYNSTAAMFACLAALAQFVATGCQIGRNWL